MPDSLHITEETKAWLESLREQDIQEIKDALKLRRRIEAGGWLFKWIGITIVSFFAGSVLLGESLIKMFGWYGGVK